MYRIWLTCIFRLIVHLCIQMYGQYTRELSEFARQEAERSYRLKTSTNNNRYRADSSTSSLQTVQSANKSCR
jgi:hypothetical protein